MSSAEKEWINLLAEILERLTDKHPSISCDFNNVSFVGETPNTQGEYLPAGKVNINGKITISVE